MDWKKTIKPRHVWLTILFMLGLALFPALGWSQAPIFEITPADSWINFHVKASVKIAGKFDKWDATLTFTSPDETTGVLEIKIQAASVDTGSGMKNKKLKGKDFFAVEQNPLITFKSTKIVRKGPHMFEVDGDFTIRGVSNPEKLLLTVSGQGTGSGEIKGSMVFNRKNYGMNKGIPFIKIADHVDVNFHLKGKRVGGPPLALSIWREEFITVRNGGRIGFATLSRAGELVLAENSEYEINMYQPGQTSLSEVATVRKPLVPIADSSPKS